MGCVDSRLRQNGALPDDDVNPNPNALGRRSEVINSSNIDLKRLETGLEII
jgi:hypothetical protein